MSMDLSHKLSNPTLEGVVLNSDSGGQRDNHKPKIISQFFQKIFHCYIIFILQQPVDSLRSIEQQPQHNNSYREAASTNQFLQSHSLYRSILTEQLPLQINSHRATASTNQFSQSNCLYKSILTEQLPQQINSHRATASTDQFSQSNCLNRSILTEQPPLQINS